MIEEVIRNAIGMRQIVKEREKTASVVMDDMYYPLSLHGWGETMPFHPINTEYPGIQVLLQVFSSRRVFMRTIHLLSLLGAAGSLQPFRFHRAKLFHRRRM